MSHNKIAKLGIVHNRSEEDGKVRGESINHRLGGFWICWSFSQESAIIFDFQKSIQIQGRIDYQISRARLRQSLLDSYEEVIKRGEGE